jgi:hypothetical protein
MAGRLGDPQRLATALPAAALVFHALGESQEAVSMIVKVEEHSWHGHPFYLLSLPDMVRIALATGKSVVAERIAETVEPIYPLHEHALVTARALLAEHRGEHAEAKNLYADAASRWERFEMPWERAQALLGRGRCLVTLGRASEAEASLRSARDIFASLRASPALGEVDSLLHRVIALSS